MSDKDIYSKRKRTNRQGWYVPLNPKKIIGDPKKIYFRSSWEKKLMFKLDTSDYILKWGSEVIVVQYISPKDGRCHRYFTDFVVVTKDPEDPKKQVVTVIEVKPDAQKRPPRNTATKKDSTYLNEVITYEVNQAKWEAARAYCKARGWQFKVMTEKQLFPEYK